MDFDEKLDELFIDLPEPQGDVGSFTSALLTGKQLYVGSVLPFAEGRIQMPGKVGIEIRLDMAKLAARTAAVLMLATVNKELGGTLNKVKRVLKLDGYVASAADFKDHLKVIDGASDLFAQIFGQNGKPVRTAIGVTSLPNNACVMLSAIFEIR
jgi:enamine deaminase RidA (YjgF/YER057c/UK114 family)